MTVTRPALRYHGAKFRLAPWTMQFFPPHVCYVEPYGGAAGVLLRKERSYAEVYNDLDGDIVNFFRVLRDPATRGALIEACSLTPYAREEFNAAYEPTDDAVERARRTAVRAAMGFGSASTTQHKSGFRSDTRRRGGTALRVWQDYPASIVMVGERFAGVLIENRPALDVMSQHDAPDTLHFVDPPYLFATRERPKGRRYYQHEMDDAAHAVLMDRVKTLQGMVVLCGYPSELYDASLTGWERHTTKTIASGNKGSVLRNEVVWLNPACSAALHRARGGLFVDAA